MDATFFSMNDFKDGLLVGSIGMILDCISGYLMYKGRGAIATILLIIGIALMWGSMDMVLQFKIRQVSGFTEGALQFWPMIMSASLMITTYTIFKHLHSLTAKNPPKQHTNKVIITKSETSWP